MGNKYKILFVSALSAELKIVKQEIKKINISNNLEIYFFESWMWNYKTIMNLSLYLVEQSFDFIINIWVCWWSSHPNPLPKGEGTYKVIQIWRIKNIANNKELIVPIFFEFWKIESIVCSEKIMTSPLTPLFTGEGENIFFVDMESYWFEMIWNKFDIPRIILKVPVDKIWEETKNFDFNKAKKFLRENINYSYLLEKIEKYLDKNSPHPSPIEEREYIVKEKIINNFKFSFSEKIIINKLLNKFIVLELWDLEDFFEENKELNKKEFLNKLKKY